MPADHPPLQLHYIMDPMCSWCYGFAGPLADALSRLPAGSRMRYVMGGLAPDSAEPMPPQTQQYVQHHWQEVAQRSGAEFNFEFWEKCTPRRSTYPACRAVICAGLQGEAHIPAMVAAIQQAYYRQARNPSEETTLLELAAEIGLDAARFAAELHSPEVARRLQADFAFKDMLGVQGFPTLVAEVNSRFYALTIGYAPAAVLLGRVEKMLEREQQLQTSS